MQFYKDINGKYAEIFLKLREILLSFQDIKEIKNAKQTSYSDNYDIVAIMRNRDNKFIFALEQGVVFASATPFFRRSRKLVHQL